MPNRWSVHRIFFVSYIPAPGAGGVPSVRPHFAFHPYYPRQQQQEATFIVLGSSLDPPYSCQSFTMLLRKNQCTILVLVGVVIALFRSLTTTAFVPHPQQHIQPVLASSSSTTSNEDTPDIGFFKTVTTNTNTKLGPKVNLGDIATIKYTCYLPDNPKAAPFARSEKQKMVVGDGTMIKGWDRALRTMSVGERAIIRITDPELGYGAKGCPPFIPPHACLELDVEVLDAQLPTTNIDFDSLANADNTPRTASAIQAAYEQRQALKALDGPAREGLQGFLDKAKNFYFFGFFEGETGERAPWFLRPSITFPIAFLIVGAAFYVSVFAGAITERGASVKDELDEVILLTSSSSSTMLSSGTMTSAMVATLFSFLEGENGLV